MKKLILLTVVFAAVMTTAITTTYAQRETATGVAIEKDINLLRGDLRSERKKLIALNVPFTDTEAAKFWPVYDQYEAEMAKINEDFYGIVRDYVGNQKMLTDEQAANFIKRWTDSQMKNMQARMRYLPMIEKVVPAKKAALFAQIDRRLRALQDIQVSAEFPLITQ